MPKFLLTLWTIAALTLAASGQKMTEIYIPIGQSPGLSGKHTVIGKVEQLNIDAKSLEIIDETGKVHNIPCTDETRFWIDRSSADSPNQKGSLSQCQEGRRVEIKYQDNDPSKPAEWVKVRPESNGG